MTALAQIIRYEIRDATGTPVAVHWRQDKADGKRLWWEAPDGTKGLGGLPLADLPLYGIERLGDWADPTVVVVEGEKAADALRAVGIQAVGAVTGASASPSAKPLAELTGRQPILWADSDERGPALMLRVATDLASIGIETRMVEWPEAPEHGDAADFLFPGKSAAELHEMAEAATVGVEPSTPTGHTLGDLRALLEGARAVALEPMTPDLGEGEGEAALSGSGGRHAPSQPSQLVALAASAELFHTPDQDPYATIPVGDHLETVALRSREMKGFLRRRYYAEHGSAAGSRAVDEAIDELEATALYAGVEHPVYLRVAELDGRQYLDLGDRSWRAIEIDRGTWGVVDRPPVRFRRSPSLFALPEPVRGGSINELRPFVNVADDAGFRILVGYLLAAYRPSGPYPVLVIRAEQGAAKTSAARVLRRLIDPARSLEIGVPKDQEGLLVAAHHHHIVSLDNVSSLPNWLSDDLSRLATGSGVALRVKYSTLDELSLYLCRPIILNGIEDFVARADLADRCWVVELPALPDARKRDEAEFEVEFTAAQPRILGAVLDAVAAGHRGIEGVRLTQSTRMVGAARFVVAAEAALNWPPGAFESELAEMRAGSRDSALEASPLTAPLVVLAARGRFEGTADDLRMELERMVDERTTARPDWPKTARGLSGQLRRLVPDLRSRGIEVFFDQREPHTRRRLLVVSKVAESTVPTGPTGPASVNEANGGRIPDNLTVPQQATTVPTTRIPGDGGDGRGRLPEPHRPPEFVLMNGPGDGGDGRFPIFDKEGREGKKNGAARLARASLAELGRPGQVGVLAQERIDHLAAALRAEETPR